MKNKNLSPLKHYTTQQLITEIKERITNDPIEMPKLIRLEMEKMKINDPKLYQTIIETITSSHTDRELSNEVIKRIQNYSLDLYFLIYPLALIGSQYVKWYEAEKQKKLNNHEI